jgi:hypothetical protein
MRFYEIAAFLEVGAKSCDIDPSRTVTFFKPPSHRAINLFGAHFQTARFFEFFTGGA